MERIRAVPPKTNPREEKSCETAESLLNTGGEGEAEEGMIEKKLMVLAHLIG